jgi:hypothetical protein
LGVFAKRRGASLDLQRAEIATAAPRAPSLPMNAVWRTIRGYILWSYERGTLHYDIMVTLILIFVFLSPKVINFNDKPTARIPHPTDVVVTPDVQGRLLYQISAGAIKPGDDQSVRDQLLRIIEPISGGVSIVNIEKVPDGRGHLQSYKVLVKRE